MEAPNTYYRLRHCESSAVVLDFWHSWKGPFEHISSAAARHPAA